MQSSPEQFNAKLLTGVVVRTFFCMLLKFIHTDCGKAWPCGAHFVHMGFVRLKSVWAS